MLCGDLKGKEIQGIGDIYIYVWLIHFAVQQKLTQHCKATILQLKKKKMKTLIQKDTCTPLFRASLFTIAKIWKQPKCSSTDEWNTIQPLKIMKICHLQQRG